MTTLPPVACVPRDIARVERVVVWSTWRLSPDKLLGGFDHQLCLFDGARGAVAQGFDEPLGPTETNLLTGGHLPHADTMVVSAVEWRVFGGTPADRQAVFEGSTWQWEFALWKSEQAPLDTFDASDYGDIPEDERVNLVEALRVRDDGLSGRLTYKGGPAPHIPPGAAFRILLRVPHMRLSTTPVCVRFALRGDTTTTLPIP